MTKKNKTPKNSETESSELSPRVTGGLVPEGAENFGLPPNWAPVPQKSFQPPTGAPPPPPAMPRNFGGSIPPGMQLPTDQIGSSYQTAGNPIIPSNRLTPLSPSGVAAVNSAVSVQTAPVAVVAATAQTTATTAQTTANAALAATFKGAWSSTTNYSIGASVDEGGAIYLSIAASLNEMPPNATYWSLLSGQASFLGAWSSTTSYTTGDIVSVSSSLYIAIANSTNENPTSTSGYWQLLTGTSVYEGTWNSGTVYSVGQTVSYTDGNFYIAISANTNEAPSPTGSSYWVLLGTSNTLIGNYSGSAAYTAGMEVIYNGNIFQALQATTGNTPPTPPATNVYWQLMGPATLAAVPDGSGVYAGTSASTSYRPLTNMLTSVDAGSNATIDIASFSLRVRTRSVTSDASYNSGSITTLSYGTLYYIYTADSTFAGGSVTYSATTTKENALSDSSYIFIGSIFTAVSGGGTTIGNNDGGSGAQNGNTVIVHPTAAVGITNPLNSIDGNPSSFASALGASQTLSCTGISGLVLPAIQGVIVVVDWSSTATGTNAATIAVSLNNGATFTTIFSTTSGFSRMQTTHSLGTNLNPGLVQIKVATGSAVSGGDGLLIYEVYLLEQY